MKRLFASFFTMASLVMAQSLTGTSAQTSGMFTIPLIPAPMLPTMTDTCTQTVPTVSPGSLVGTAWSCTLKTTPSTVQDTSIKPQFSALAGSNAGSSDHHAEPGAHCVRSEHGGVHTSVLKPSSTPSGSPPS